MPKSARKAKDEPKLPVRRGRPTDWRWSEELMDDICDHLSTGKSLLDIGKLKGFPSSDSMYRQMARDPDFAAKCARAREAGQDHEADACVAMADMATNEDREVVRLRIETRKWRAAQLAPKRYGALTRVAGADGGAIQVEGQQPIPWDRLSAEEREAVVSALRLAQARALEARVIEDEDE